jgi:hypothetical protein
LTTTGWKSGNKHKIEIWFVYNINNKRHYIMSEGMEKAHWVKNITHDSKISFYVDKKAFEGKARVVDKNKEPALAAEVCELMTRKYNWDQGLIVELVPADS